MHLIVYHLHREAPLENLNLEGCGRVSNAGVRSLIAGKPLTWLKLQDMRVTDEILPTIQSLPRAAELSLHVTKGMFSEASLEGMREAISSLHVAERSYYYYNS